MCLVSHGLGPQLNSVNQLQLVGFDSVANKVAIRLEAYVPLGRTLS